MKRFLRTVLLGTIGVAFIGTAYEMYGKDVLAEQIINDITTKGAAEIIVNGTKNTLRLVDK